MSKYFPIVSIIDNSKLEVKSEFPDVRKLSKKIVHWVLFDSTFYPI